MSSGICNKEYILDLYKIINKSPKDGAPYTDFLYVYSKALDIGYDKKTNTYCRKKMIDSTSTDILYMTKFINGWNNNEKTIDTPEYELGKEARKYVEENT